MAGQYFPPGYFPPGYFGPETSEPSIFRAAPASFSADGQVLLNFIPGGFFAPRLRRILEHITVEGVFSAEPAELSGDVTVKNPTVKARAAKAAWADSQEEELILLLL